MSVDELTSVELFAGCGGLLLGSSRAGFNHIAAVEWNHDSCETLRYNQESGWGYFENMRIIEGDIREADWGFIDKDIDLLSGGPPCQPFSLGGLARAASDTRDMFPAFIDVLSMLRPRAFVVENVKGLTRPAFSDYYRYILYRLQYPLAKAFSDETWRDHLKRLERIRTNGADDSLQYVVTPTVVDAADYGVPQHRHRIFIVGFRSDVKAEWSFPEPSHAKTSEFGKNAWLTVADAINGLPKPRKSDRRGAWPSCHALQKGAKPYPGHTGSILAAPSKALKAGVHGVPGGENMLHLPDESYRYMTIREAMRIQTFPDSYHIMGTWSEAMRQIGNAVPVELARRVCASVAIALREDALRKNASELIDAEYCELVAMANNTNFDLIEL